MVDVTILAISPRISILLGSLLQPLLPTCPILFSPCPPRSTLLFLDSAFTELQYLPVLGFLNRFVLCLPLRRRVISERANLCTGEMVLMVENLVKGCFFLQQPYTCWWPSPPCCLYVRIPSAGQSGSLGVRRGVLGGAKMKISLSANDQRTLGPAVTQYGPDMCFCQLNLSN